MAVASGRPRPLGLADVLEGATQAGDLASLEKARRLLTSGRDRFREAGDLAWEAAAENELGLFHLGADRFDEADACFARAVELYSRAFNPRHRLVALVLRNRGNVPSKRQDHATAIRYYRQAADLLDKATGEAVVERAGMLQNLAAAYFAQGDMPAAIGPVREALEILRKERGPNAPRSSRFWRCSAGCTSRAARSRTPAKRVVGPSRSPRSPSAWRPPKSSATSVHSPTMNGGQGGPRKPSRATARHSSSWSELPRRMSRPWATGSHPWEMICPLSTIYLERSGSIRVQSSITASGMHAPSSSRPP